MFAAIERFLGQAGPWSLVVVFIVIVLESAAGLGLIFPGEAMAVIAGAMAADNFFSPWTAFVVVALAAMIGDLTGYTIGHTKGKAVLARWAFARRQYEEHRKRIEYYFDRYGGATVFVGRFVAVGRAFVPFTAGLSGMRIRKFLPMSVLAGLVWSSVVVGLGYTLGSNWSLIEKWLKSLSLGIVVLAILTGLVGGMWRSVARRQTQIVAAWKRYLTGRYGVDLTPFVNFVRARFSPGRRGSNEKRLQAGLARRHLDIGPAVREPHRRFELEPVALAGFDREREQAIRGQRPRHSSEQRREVADIDERVRCDDEIGASRRLTTEHRRSVSDHEPIIDSAVARFRDHGRREVDAGEAVDTSAQGLAHEPRAAAQVQG